MASEEGLFKREDDQKWRDRVEERIVNLQNGEATQNDRLTDHDEELHGISEILEGVSADRSDNGMKGDLHDLSVAVNALRSLMAPDSLGQGGVIARLKALEKKAGLEEKVTDNRWAFATKVMVATIGAMATILVALLAIEPVRNAVALYLHSHCGAKPVESALKQTSKRPKL